MWRLQGALGEIAGLPHVSLQPSAGSHGELAGPAPHPRLPRGPRRAAHEGAHAGHRARHQPRHRHDGGLRGGQGRHRTTDGGVDLDDLREKADDDVACLMLTNPNTLGLFDRNIEEIAEIVHDVGRHALLRRREPERGDGHRAARRHGLRHRPLQPAQDVHPAARRRRPGRRPDRVLGPHRALPARAAGGGAPRRQRLRAPLRPRPRPAQVDRQAARLPGQLRRVRALVRLHLLARRRRAEGRLARRRC